MTTKYFTLDDKHVYGIEDDKISRVDLDLRNIDRYNYTESNVGYLNPNEYGFALMMSDNEIVRISRDDFMEVKSSGRVEPTELSGVLKITFDIGIYGSIKQYKGYKVGNNTATTLYEAVAKPDNKYPNTGNNDASSVSSSQNASVKEDSGVGVIWNESNYLFCDTAYQLCHVNNGQVSCKSVGINNLPDYRGLPANSGFNDDTKNSILVISPQLNRVARMSRNYYNRIATFGKQEQVGNNLFKLDFGLRLLFSESNGRDGRYLSISDQDIDRYIKNSTYSRTQVKQEGNNLGLINKTVTRMFTLDSKNVYKVVNGIVVREPIGDLSQYANTGPEVGYLDQSNQWALMVNNGKIVRIKRDKFMDIKAAGSTEVDPQMPGLLTITYDTAKVPDNTLGVSTQYKLADKKGGDFDNIPNPVQSVSSQPNNTATESKSQKSNDAIPDLVQDLAKQNLGRTITEVDISLFRQLLDAIDTNNGIIRPNELKKEEDQTLRGFINSGHVLFSSQNQIFTIAVPNPLVLNCMRRAVEMYDGAQLVNGGKQPDPIHVVAAAMNMAKEDRERIGLVNQGTPVQQNVDTGSGRRFGSSAKTGGDGSVSVGSLHRPRALSSSTVFPFDVPCVVRKTAPYYTMLTMHKPFIEYTKPIESFLTANITIDKRIPMRVVPMVTDDKHGYAYPKKVKSEEKVVSDKCIPVATREPGIYWMFYEMKRAVDIETQEFQFICNILIEYINSNSMSFDLSKSGVVAGVASSVSTAIDEIGYDTSNKQEAIDVYRKFFEETGKGLFRPMKVSYKSGFVIAMTRGNTQVLLTSVIINNSNVEWSQYPEHITIIPIGGEFGLLIVGAEPSDISDIERVMSRVETIEDEEGEYDQPDD